ncbi:MAG: hypothetical protein RJB34_1611 [Pseudomonadota bacterium]
MPYVVFAAMLASMIVLSRRGIQTTFLWVWIPVFLSMPTIFWVNIPGLPDPNFMQAAIIPMLFVLLRDQLPNMRMERMEWLILTYIVIRVVADFLSRGYADAQNYGFYLLTALMGPYLLGKYVISSRQMDVATAKTFVTLFLIFFAFFLFEAQFWVSPIFKYLSPLFPGSYSGLSLRWGFARTAGTFEHPILACIMVLITYRLHRWLCWSGAWDPQNLSGFYLRWHQMTRQWPITMSTQISLVLLLMALMTISRGPWIGGLAAAVVVFAGNTQNRLKSLKWVALIFVVGGFLGKTLLDIYTTPADGAELSGEAQTMLYRRVMIEKYQAFLMERMWQGWGLTGVPKIRGMESVDNAFFLMALQHGVLAPTIFTAIFVYAMASQIKLGLKFPVGVAPIGFTFAGVYLMCFIAFLTVYMGAQTEPMLFLLLGWGESIKLRYGSEPTPGGSVVPSPTASTGWNRVLH